MKWGRVTWSNALDAYDDHAGASVPRHDRPQLWEAIIDVPPHPSDVAVIVSVDYRRAVDWCRRYGVPCPPRRGSPYIVTPDTGSDKIRGCNFYDDDEYIVLGPVDPDLVAEVNGRMMVAKMRKMGPRPVAV